jgi:hypothetical protein
MWRGSTMLVDRLAMLLDEQQLAHGCVEAE